MVARTKNKAAVNKYMFLLVEILVRAMKKSILLVFSDCEENERMYSLFVLYFFCRCPYMYPHPTLVLRYLQTKSLISYIPLDT
jgi:hypothetical protein